MMVIRLLLSVAWTVLLVNGSVEQALAARSQSPVIKVTANDGTSLAVECSGAGPTLLIVHGGTGDRQRWQPLSPLFTPNFTVCAMHRRPHGQSEAGSNYSLRKEFEDVVAV